MEKTYSASCNHKKAGVATLSSDQIGLSDKNVLKSW